MEAHECVLPFDTDSAEFARGFEAGRLWAVLEASDEDAIEQIVHASNLEMVLRMAERLDRHVRSEDLDDTWVLVRFAPAGVRELTAQ